MADPYDNFCKRDTPQDLKEALFGGDQDRLRAWCKMNPDRLSLALDCIHMHHPVYREIVQLAMSANQQAETKARSEKLFAQAERHHSDRQWWTRFAAWVAFLSAVVGLASFLAGRFLPPPQDRELSRRVSALEQQLSVVPPKLKPTALPPTAIAPQPTSTPTPKATP